FVRTFERDAQPTLENTPDLGDDWIQSIHRASARVHALSTDPARPTAAKAEAPRASSPPKPPAPDMTPVFAMLHGDRFSDALTYVRELQASDDPDVLLVEAMLLAHNRKTTDAENVCHKLLCIDEMNASAHHVLALCRETAGDLDAAMEHDRIAAY